MKNLKTQVNSQLYYENYDSLPRFISYYHQIDLTLKLNPKTLLEIGVGNKTVASVLKERGVKVTTCDFDESLKPDVVADIRKLPFRDNEFDIVMTCQTLEHIPWDHFETALKELKRVTKKYVIISVPYSSLYFDIIFRLPYTELLFKKHFFNIFFRFPLFMFGYKFNGEHYWEMGRRGYSKNKIRKILKKQFKIKKECRATLNAYHYFFVLEK